MKLELNSLKILDNALRKLEDGFDELPEMKFNPNPTRLNSLMDEVAKRMQNNYPYFHPLYAGQMLKPPHSIARLAYILSLWVNPNNHALDGGKASSEMEKEAVKEIAENLFGWSEFIGHLTSGGTMANMEALWISGQIRPGKAIAASELAHYTHERLSSVLNLKFNKIKCTQEGIIDLNYLEDLLKKGEVGTVVATMGTTGAGAVDPIDEIVKLKEKYDFRLHADAAYGGYFTLAYNLREETIKKFEKMPEADSIVVDPHKHGLQPYGCGAIFFKDPAVGKYYKHDSPYTYFTSGELHLGEISLECSRAGASAVALWATQKLLPLVKGGEFANDLEKNLAAAVKFYNYLNESDKFIPLYEPELDIVNWIPVCEDKTKVSEESQKIFDRVARSNLHLALMKYPVEYLNDVVKEHVHEKEYVTCLRSVLMKPEHLDWIDEIWKILNA